MLARKFLHYQQERPRITGDETEEELTGPPPPSLYLLAACMIKVCSVTVCWRRYICAPVCATFCSVVKSLWSRCCPTVRPKDEMGGSWSAAALTYAAVVLCTLFCSVVK